MYMQFYLVPPFLFLLQNRLQGSIILYMNMITKEEIIAIRLVQKLLGAVLLVMEKPNNETA